MPRKALKIPETVAPFTLPSPVASTVSPFQRELILRSLTEYKSYLSQVFRSTMKHYDTNAGSLYHFFVINQYLRSNKMFPSFFSVFIACHWLQKQFGYITSLLLRKYTGYSSFTISNVLHELTKLNYIKSYHIKYYLTFEGSNKIASINKDIYNLIVNLYIQ